MTETAPQAKSEIFWLVWSVPRVQLVRLALLAHRVLLVLKDQLALKVLLAHKVPLVLKD
jgi:hypothetical protein